MEGASRKGEISRGPEQTPQEQKGTWFFRTAYPLTLGPVEGVGTGGLVLGVAVPGRREHRAQPGVRLPVPSWSLHCPRPGKQHMRRRGQRLVFCPDPRPGLLEPGDVPALLQVPDALVVVLLREGAAQAAGLQGGLLVLSAQSLDGLVVGLGLPGPRGRAQCARAAGRLLEVFDGRVEVIAGRRGPPGSSWAAGVAGLGHFERLPRFIDR